MTVAEYKAVVNSGQEFPESRTSFVLWVFDHESNVRRRAMERLERDGFCVRMVPIGSDLARRARQLYPSLVVIETINVRGSALEVCRGIRQLHSLSRTPIVFLSAGASQDDRALALESGGDDCVAEPWSGREIVARLRAVLRRFMRQETCPSTLVGNHHFPQYFGPSIRATMKVGEIEIDTNEMRVEVRGSVVETTSLEFRLLYYLLQNPGRVFSRDQLLNAVWGAEFVELRSVDACVRRLRRKIELHPLRPSYLRTVRGAGYCLKPRETDAA
jgi:DNA-binding response OmpR family regulator